MIFLEKSRKPNGIFSYFVASQTSKINILLSAEKSFMITFHKKSLFFQNKQRHETSTHFSSSELGFQSEWSRFKIDMEISS